MGCTTFTNGPPEDVRGFAALQLLVAASRVAPTKLAGQQGTELAAPETSGLVADLYAALGELLFDITVAE